MSGNINELYFDFNIPKCSELLKCTVYKREINQVKKPGVYLVCLFYLLIVQVIIQYVFGI
jgi:hypothetical protein